ncbi:hypothetical protein [Methylobacterium radiotolerans]|uniref:hypothetical protein n=1 Tax=Methylobacterium radiotolerans TaxID=31998 RepID=UPI0015F5B521|nr:hypothetical protein [Methylobacterium radiotolerans]
MSLSFKISDAISVVSIFVSAGAAWYSYNTSVYVQDRQSIIEELRALDDSGQKILEAGANFINSINSQSDLKASKEKLNILLAQQAMAAINARRKLKPSDYQYAEDYVNALRELGKISQNTNQSTEMRPWAEAFGRALDARTTLAQAISATM